MLNKQMLKSKMALYGDGIVELAQALGISTTRLSAKMNNKQVSDKVRPAVFTQTEIYIIMKRYQLTPEEVILIFFNDEATV